MATIVFLGTSVISLFFSFILATELFQRKEWPNSYLCLSILFYSLASLSLFIGHVFAWYTWTKVLFSITYALIFPNLLGVGIYYLVRKLKPTYTVQVSIGYASLLLILTLSYLTQLVDSLNELDTAATIFAIAESTASSPLYLWLTILCTLMFILSSIWLWLRGEGLSWLWFIVSGVIYILVGQFLAKQGLSMASFSILWFIFLGSLWRALSIDFPLDLNRENRRATELNI